MMATPDHDIGNPALAAQGCDRIEWALGEMPVLSDLLAHFAEEQPLAGQRISACLHVTAETANLMRVLVAGGASLRLCASNPLSTQDDVAAALVMHYGVPTFTIRGADQQTYYRHLQAALDHGPHVTLDDGADLVSTLHRERPELLDAVIGGTEETTTGVLRLRAMAADGALRYPIIAVNDAHTKHLFDNRYGTGQSTIDGILRATNLLLAGRVFTVCGYGWCGRGIAARAHGHGARVIVTEVEPLRALEAAMDGFQVMPLAAAAARADLIVTATGNRDVVGAAAFEGMKDGCILANAGHFDAEIDLATLRDMARERRQARPLVEEYLLDDGRRIRVLAEGRLVNLVAAEGHPAAVMDMSFANQALCAAYLAARGGELDAAVHPVPAEIDRTVAQLKLQALGLRIDQLSEAQAAYLKSWQEGT